MSRPQAVPEALICSECGLNWDLHPENPRRRDCIELLKRPAPVSIPWYTTNQVCNWGHYNCLIQHENWWITYDSGTTFSGDFSNIANATTISILPTPDDPDMGTPAKVS